MSMKVDRTRVFDKRVVQRYIRAGRVTKEEYAAWLTALDDAEPNITPQEEGGDSDGYEPEAPAEPGADDAVAADAGIEGDPAMSPGVETPGLAAPEYGGAPAVAPAPAPAPAAPAPAAYGAPDPVAPPAPAVVPAPAPAPAVVPAPAVAPAPAAAPAPAPGIPGGTTDPSSDPYGGQGNA